jgi:hypothetical protein
VPAQEVHLPSTDFHVPVGGGRLGDQDTPLFPTPFSSESGIDTLACRRLAMLASHARLWHE